MSSACAPNDVERLTSEVTTPATATQPATLTPAPLPSATVTELPAPALLPCTEEVCVKMGHFIFERPIAANLVDIVDPTYRYGNTAYGERKTHHGVEFVNPQGTPVRAAADGTVIVAGTDYQQPYADFPAFYGNLVIIEHHFSDPQLTDYQLPIYTLYGHLSEVHAEVGQSVQAGDTIGLVGFTGAAIGEHLHFEIRQGENSYRTTRNPELWLQPHRDQNNQPTGAIAGHALDEYGGFIYLPSVTIEQLDPAGGDPLAVYYIEGYADWTVNGDDIWNENFALGNIPAGQYRVSFVARGLQSYIIDVFPDMVTVISFDARQSGD